MVVGLRGGDKLYYLHIWLPFKVLNARGKNDGCLLHCCSICLRSVR